MNTICKIFFLLILFSILLVSCSRNKTEYEKEGNSTLAIALSSDDVTSFAMDQDNMMWIGTSYGLNLYDGHKYQQFFYEENNPSSIPGNNIQALYRDSKDRIWIGTDNGIACYLGNGNFKTYETGTSLSNVNQIIETSDNNIFMANDKHIYKFNGNKFHVIISFSEYKNGSKICSDNNGGLWLFTPFECLHYNKDGNLDKAIKNNRSANLVYMYRDTAKVLVSQSRNLTLIDLNTNEIIYKTPKELTILPTLLLIKDKNIFLSSEKHGLYTFNFKTDQTAFLNENTFPLKKRHIQISCFYIDNNKNLWIGFREGGFQVLSPADQQVITLNHNMLVSETKNKKVSALAKCRNGSIWGATDTHIFYYDIKTDNISFFEQNKIFFDSPYYRQILNKIVPEGDTVWFLTNVRIVRCSFSNNKLHVDRSINIGPILNDLLVTSDYNYIVSDSKYLYIQNKKNNSIDSLLINHPSYNGKTKLLQMSSGNILLFMENMNLALLDPNSLEYNPIKRSNNFIKNGLTPSTILEDSQKHIWLGSRNHGLFKFNFQNNHIEDVQSLPSLNIMSMIEDSVGNLWIGTRKGLMCYSPKEGKSYLYAMRMNDRSEYPIFSEQSACPYLNNMLLFGCNNGCTIVSPSLLQHETDSDLAIRRIRIRKKEGEHFVVKKKIFNEDHLTLSYDESDLEISFGGVNFGNTPLYLYEYKMEGFDHSWNYTQNDLNISYSNLPAGDYIFRVRAMQSSDSSIIDDLSVKITILPAPWLTTPAIIGYIILFVLLIVYINYLYLRIRTNKLKLDIASRDKEREYQTNQMNMSFFANMSHEFRNPLTMISGPIYSMVNDISLSINTRRKLNAVHKNVHLMLRLIDQMLDFNQLDQDVLKLKVAPFDIVNEIDLWIEVFKIVAEERSIEIEKEGMSSSYFTLLDHDKLDKILNNLFTNALKHTPDNGMIRFQLRVMSSEEINSLFQCGKDFQYKYICISVYNNGKQIPKEKLTDIFKRYYQLKNIGENHNYGWGTGIGLYYVERLVNLHHGYIQANNEPEGGVTFSFAIPINEDAYLMDERIGEEKNEIRRNSDLMTFKSIEESLERENTQAQKPKLLIVDDDVEISRYLKSIFNNDYQIINKYSAESAIKEMSQIMPDVILSDVIMDEISGYDFCKTIKSDIMYSHIPFILITAKSAIDDQIQGLDLGADAYIGKPFNPNYLQAVIRSQIKNRNNMRKLLQEQTFLGSMDSELSSQDKIFMKELYSLMDKYLSDSELNLENICENMHMSRSKFNYKMKGLTGETPNNFFKKYKLNRAAKLLREGKYNVSEVSMMTGFGTVSHFSVSFKKQFGINPSEYK